MTSTNRATLEQIRNRHPRLAAAVETQVTRLMDIVLPAADGAIAIGRQRPTPGSTVSILFFRFGRSIR